jgi:hypothetical protein
MLLLNGKQIAKLKLNQIYTFNVPSILQRSTHTGKHLSSKLVRPRHQMIVPFFIF